MTPAARLQAAIEILDEVISSVKVDGLPADTIVTQYFKQRRYAGSKDRRSVRELVFSAIRHSANVPANGRAAVLTLARSHPELLDAFGQPRGPEPLAAGEETGAPPSRMPDWLCSELSPLIGEEEFGALLERAPLDLRVNISRTTREQVLAAYTDARLTTYSPWGVRLPTETRVDDTEPFESGLVEVQDEGSQLIALACEPRDGETIIDLCAGAGGKSLALAAAAPRAKILATDSNKARLAKLPPRAERAGARIETQLLDPPHELAQLEKWHGGADLVLVDAPCSGSGTWRRNPEGRWRLTRTRLERLEAAQARLLDIAATLVRPGGHLVYAVCSILSREGAMQIEDFLQERSSWIREEPRIAAGREDGPGRLLTPGHDGTDGFFIARLRRP